MNRYTVICIPGRTDDDPGAWFVLDRQAPPEDVDRAIRCDDRAHAVRLCRQLNENARNAK